MNLSARERTALPTGHVRVALSMMILRIVHTMHNFAEERLGHLSPVIETYIVCVVIYLLDRLQVACFFAVMHAQCMVVAATIATVAGIATCAATPAPTGIVSYDLSVFYLVRRSGTNKWLVLTRPRQRCILQIQIVLILVILHRIIQSASEVCT